MTDLQNQIWDTLVSLDSEALLSIFVDYRGGQILDEGFAEFLIDEGIIDAPLY
jgi:hypothetical protein